MTENLQKIAFLFPGQGSQEVGMGADLFERSAFFRQLVAIGSEMLAVDLRHVCLRGPSRELRRASRAQALLSAVSLGYWHELIERGVKPDIVLGHSLGEISALAAAGVVTPDDAVRMATYRGQLMDQVADRVEGGMVAALFAPLSMVQEILNSLRMPARIVLANDNAPDQVVVSGDNDALERFMALMTQRGVGKCRRLEVAGPWHSPYMTEARHTFESWVERIAFKPPRVPLVLNALAREENHPLTIRHLITYQLTSPVYWRESMNYLREQGVGVLVEVGPGRVLSGLARVNGFRKDIRIFNANTVTGVETAVKVLRELKGG